MSEDSHGDIVKEKEIKKNESRVNPATSLKKLLNGLSRRKNGEDSVRDAIEELIEESSKVGDGEKISLHEHMLLSNILDLRETKAEDVMTPRVDIIAVEDNESIKSLAHTIIEKGFSRIPIFKETLDEIVGVVHVKNILELLVEEKDKTIKEIMSRDIIFVSPAMRVLDLLKDMQMKRMHMAFVVDEYGGIDGLITIEDLVEEIVGEIEDEHDLDKPDELLLTEKDTIEADARAELEELENMIGYFLSDEERQDEDIDTVGGLVFQLAGRIPVRGEIIPHSSGVQFRVVEVDPRRIKHVTVFNLPKNNLKKVQEKEEE